MFLKAITFNLILLLYVYLLPGKINHRFIHVLKMLFNYKSIKSEKKYFSSETNLFCGLWLEATSGYETSKLLVNASNSINNIYKAIINFVSASRVSTKKIKLAF